MAAVICVISLLQLPLATGVPLTFQVFAVALSGYVLGSLRGTGAVLIYAAIGLVGVPVLSGFVGGFSVLFGPTGGFIAGFFLLALLTGLGRDKKTVVAILLGMLGLTFFQYLQNTFLQHSLCNGNSLIFPLHTPHPVIHHNYLSTSSCLKCNTCILRYKV